MRRRLLTLTAVAALTALPHAATPQDGQTDEDRGFLEGLIEDNLSNGDFSVDIVGFEGALSSEATLEELRIADAEGVWLTLRDVTLDWSRTALLRGRFQVDELTAAEIIVPRPPGPSQNDTIEVPDAAAQPFSLPELPVSVNIGRIAAERVELGEPVIGVPAIITLEGSASLADGEGEVDLSIERIDDTRGEIALSGSYANDSNTLAIDLSLDEAAGGIAATLLDIPGRPALALSVEGEGPLSDFAADLRLATDGEDRLNGRVTVADIDGDTSGTAFAANLEGDIRPLLPEANREFFGDSLSLDVAGRKVTDGNLSIDTLDLQSEAIDLTGEVVVGPDGWPALVDLQGTIASEGGRPTSLPIPGDPTLVDSVDLDVSFDASQGEAWTADLAITGLDRPTLAAETLGLTGSGTLTRGTGSAVGAVSGGFDLSAEALEFTDPGLAEAAGDGAEGRIEFAYTEGDPLELPVLRLKGAGVSVDGALQVAGVDGALDLQISGVVDLVAEEIARFSGLAGREIAGSVDVNVDGAYTPVSGAFDARVEGTATDLVTGVAELDPLIDGRTDLVVDAARDETGLTLRTLELDAPGATIEAEARLVSPPAAPEAEDAPTPPQTEPSRARFDISVADMSDVTPEMSGPATVQGTATELGDDWRIDVTASGPGGLDADVEATLALVENALTAVNGTGTIAMDDLSVLSGLLGRDLGGAVDVTGRGAYALDSRNFDVTVTGSATDPVTGIPEATRLLEGRTTFALDAAGTGTTYTLRGLTLDGQRAEIDASGLYAEDGSTAQFDITLSDLADVVEGMSGGASLRGTLDQDGEAWSADVTGSGPGGARVDVEATAQLIDLALQSVAGSGDIAVEDLSVYQDIARRPLGGSVSLQGTGSYDMNTRDFTVDAEGTATDIETGIAEATALLEGRTTFSVDASGADETYTVRDLTVDGQRISVDASGTYREADSNATFDVTLSDLADVVEGMTGGASLQGTVSQDGDTLTADVTGSGPGGARADIEATAQVDGLSVQSVEGGGTVAVDDLAVYEALANRPLGGAVTLEGRGAYDLATMDFTVDANGTATDIETGIPQATALLEGTTTLTVDAAGEAGRYTLDTLRVVSPRASITASGRYREDGSSATFDVELSDLADVVDGMTGGARLQGQIDQQGTDWTADVTGSGPGGAAIDLEATADVVGTTIRQIAGGGSVSVNTLAPYQGLIGQPLRGSVSVDGTGSFTPESGAFSADLTAEAGSLRTGIDPVDRLLGGTTTLDADVTRSADGVLAIDTFRLDAANLDATASGTYGQGGGAVSYDVRLADVGLYAPDFSGPATANGTARLAGGQIQLDADLTGPGGTQANVAGSLAQNAATADLAITGSGPLGLANAFLEPNVISGTAQFDLRLDGAPGLDALSGTVTSNGAAFVLASQNIRLENIDTTVGLNGGRANIDLQAGVDTGGSLSVNGPVTLSAPFNGDLAIALNEVGVEQPGLYATTLNGQLSLTGPLASTAQISGRIELGETEVRVPSGGSGAASLSFSLEHVNPPADVRRTLDRAGIDLSPEPEGGDGGGGGVNYGLDIVISAPSRIFVRGRGLDAELGGQLAVTGTTQNVIPQGRFELIRGRLDILGQRIILDEAQISLEGDFNPILTVVATTQRDDATITVRIDGPANDPEVSFSSSPDRPEEEVLSLLLFGRDLSEISGLQALRIAAALNTLAGRGGGGTLERLRQSTGLDNLDVQTTADGQTEVSAGTYINERTYSDVTVNSSGETEINLNLTVTPSITARGSVSSTGNTGIGIYYERDY